MKTTTQFFLSIVIIFCFSCNSGEKQGEYKAQMKLGFQSVENLDFSDSLKCNIIDLQKAEIFEEIPIDIEFVKLKTPINEIIGTIDRIEFDDEKIFILDKKSSSIHIFQNNGSFINCIKSIGNGPEEYNTLMDFSIDKKNKCLVLWDAQKKKYLKFDYSGNFISAKHFWFWFKEFIISDSGNYILFTNNGNGTGSRIIIADSTGVNIIGKTLPSDQYYKLNFYSKAPILNKYKTGIICSFPFSNRIFSIDNNKTICSYELLPADLFYKYNPETHPDFNTFEKDFLALTDRYIFLGSAIETEAFLFTSLNSSSKKYAHMVYSKNSKKTRMGHIRIPNTKFSLQSPIKTLNNKFVTHLFPYQLIDNKEMTKNYPIFTGIKEEDNPYLVIFSIKKF